MVGKRRQALLFKCGRTPVPKQSLAVGNAVKGGRVAGQRGTTLRQRLAIGEAKCRVVAAGARQLVVAAQGGIEEEQAA